MVVEPADQCQKLLVQLYKLLMEGVNNRNMYSCLQKYNKMNTVGQFLKVISIFYTVLFTDFILLA